MQVFRVSHLRVDDLVAGLVKDGEHLLVHAGWRSVSDREGPIMRVTQEGMYTTCLFRPLAGCSGLDGFMFSLDAPCIRVTALSVTKTPDDQSAICCNAVLGSSLVHNRSFQPCSTQLARLEFAPGQPC